MTDQERMIEALHDPACYSHEVGQVRHVETHISHVLLTGPYAYKIKKPLDLGFLDFGTLNKRRHCCEEELRLNRRLAPDVYLELVSLNGEVSAPRVNGPGPVLEYAVKMRQFDAAATLDRLDEAGQLQAAHVDAIAATVADFHARIPAAQADSAWGGAAATWRPVAQNFEQIAQHAKGNQEVGVLAETLRRWSEAEHARLAPLMDARLQQGFVRECHGDLHLGNMAWEAGRLLVFDCIEFNPALRWIDVMSETAFCWMDLLQRGHADLASRFLNRYLEITGDYAGVSLLRYYAVYRAMVRAKVAFIRAGQPRLGEEVVKAETRQGLAYLRLAEGFIRPRRPVLLITHGLSGSGKTTFSRQLIQRTGMIALRSDIERKRLAGLEALARSGAGIDSGIYNSDFSRRTYEYLGELSGLLLQAGWSVLADATFIARWQRDLFRGVATNHGADFLILDFSVADEVLRQRVQARCATGNDASEADLAVLERQLQSQEPLNTEENRCSIAATLPEQVAARLSASLTVT